MSMMLKSSIRSTNLSVVSKRFSPVSVVLQQSTQRNLSLFKTIPQPPGYIVGTVNDAYVTPPPDKLHGSRHWTFERFIGVGLVPLTIAPFAFGSISPATDSILSVLLLIHSYTGFQSCIIDYIPKRVYGGLHNAAMYLLSFGSGVSLYGIYLMESNDVGFTNLFMKLWN